MTSRRKALKREPATNAEGTQDSTEQKAAAPEGAPTTQAPDAQHSSAPAENGSHQDAAAQPAIASAARDPPAEQPAAGTSDADDEGPLYTAMIIALSIGIVIVIATLIIMRPEPEYFTELYYTNHTLLPKYIERNTDYLYSVTIHNLENGTVDYTLITTVSLYTKDKQTDTTTSNETVTVAQGDTIVREHSFRITQDFTKAKIMTSFGEQEIHFWAHNKAYMTQYPDFVATTSCLKQPITIIPTESITIRARGSYGPMMRVLQDGVERYSTTVESTNYTDYVIPMNISTGYLDIVFDNDYNNATSKQDRNLYIKEVRIGNVTMTAAQGTVDAGTGAKAYDCETTKEITEAILWNAALRFRVAS